MINRIDDLRGNPSLDPHGDPIPTRSGTLNDPVDAQRLTNVAPGCFRAARSSDDDPTQLAWFEFKQIVTDASLIFISRSPDGTTNVAIADRNVVLSKSAADAAIAVPQT